MRLRCTERLRNVCIICMVLYSNMYICYGIIYGVLYILVCWAAAYLMYIYIHKIQTDFYGCCICRCREKWPLYILSVSSMTKLGEISPFEIFFTKKISPCKISRHLVTFPIHTYLFLRWVLCLNFCCLGARFRLNVEVGPAWFFRARVVLGLHTSGLGFLGLKKFTK
jgi:hypothetical protein